MPFMHDTGEGSAVRESLLHFDNHDARIPYYELMLEQDLKNVSELPLPAGYRYVSYTPGSKETWIGIERSAREFRSREEGEEAWQRYYAARENELEGRMFFVADNAGRMLATATAFYDIRTGDDGENGWLHWVAVRRDAQGRGLSKPLITHVLQCMKNMGYKRCVVPTQTTTWLACKVYLDLGFRPIAKNAERNRTGWRIIRTLTDHHALAGFDPVAPRELLADGRRYPVRAEAERLLAEAEQCNPGPWGDHSRTAAHCAEQIALRCGMDPEKAYVLGLLHDIGRKFGKRHLGHVSDGYSYMTSLGYDDAARICLTHSFNGKTLRGYIGNIDTTDGETALIREKLQEAKTDDYDRLIRLCDAISGAGQVMDIIDRMTDVKNRYGSYDPEKWQANLDLKSFFEAKMGMDLYDAVAGNNTVNG